jgi:capsular polysaccharide export protein
MPARRYLFLQGHATWFYLRLGHALQERGHAVAKVNFCGGDRHFWRAGATDWPHGTEGLADFMRDAFARDAHDGIILFGDCRPLHRVAIAEAAGAGIQVNVFEEGYRRPNWITLERGGVNGYSRLPDEPLWYRDTAKRLAPPAERKVGSSLKTRILLDFEWQLANYRYLRRYPGYRVHRPYPIWAEYATWATRLATLKLRQAQSRHLISRWIGGGRRFYLLPLQLDSDAQIRTHSPFGGMWPAIDSILRNFAAHAPADRSLLIKNHPLDNAWIDYRRKIQRLAGALDLGDRVAFVEGGNLEALIDRALGTVVVNSTVGMTAVSRGRPVLCLGPAIFDVAGLTSQSPLSQFWRDPPAPDAALYRDYLAVLTAAALVNGDFYTEAGIESAIEGAIARLDSDVDLLASAPMRRRTMEDYRQRAVV